MGVRSSLGGHTIVLVESHVVAMAEGIQVSDVDVKSSNPEAERSILSAWLGAPRDAARAELLASSSLNFSRREQIDLASHAHVALNITTK